MRFAVVVPGPAALGLLRRVMELIRSAVEQGGAKGLVVVTHDARILDIAHRVLTMEDGHLRAA